MTIQEFVKKYGTKGATVAIRSAVDVALITDAHSKLLHEICDDLQSALEVIPNG